MDEHQLLQNAARGDESAFLDVYRNHRDSVFRFAYRMTGAVDAADEIAHDAFLALIKGASNFNGRHGSLRAYLLGITRNLTRRRLIREGRYTGLDEALEIPSSHPGPEQRELQYAVRDAVAALPDGQREALILFEYEGLSLDEVAKVLEIEAGAVKARLHRARASLRQRLEAFHKDGYDRR